MARSRKSPRGKRANATRSAAIVELRKAKARQAAARNEKEREAAAAAAFREAKRLFRRAPSLPRRHVAEIAVELKWGSVDTLRNDLRSPYAGDRAVAMVVLAALGTAP